MPVPPTEWLQKAADRRLEVTGENVWKAMRHRAYIQVIDTKGNVVESAPKLDKVSEFRVTERGHRLLEDSKKTVGLPFNKNDLPQSHELWLSSLRRCFRNIPKGFKLAEKDGEIHVLVTDTDGKVENDAAHRIASLKVPWVESK